MNILKRRSEFVKVSQSGYKWVTPAFIIQLDRDPSILKTEIGFTASKKVGNAVKRNRAKRRLRVLAREYLAVSTRPSSRYVLVARHTAVDYPFEKLREDMIWALRKVHNQWDEGHA